jgi:PPOX class probable F420-dependent enzyme
MIDSRLLSDHNIWLATVRADGRPHLVPIWFVWTNERFYICTEGKSVKVKNIAANPCVSVSLEDGNKPVIAEGNAALIERPYPAQVIAAFKDKYQWDIGADTTSGYNALIEIVPEKWLKW